MKFLISSATNLWRSWQGHAPQPCEKAVLNSEKRYEVELETLEDLMLLVDEVGHDIIIDRESILIYDSLVE